MNIMFIIVGWHFDAFPEFVDQFILLKQMNPDLRIFWTCHKEPSQKIKDNFEYKVFENIGLEDGAYQQALDYLTIPDDTILFLMHDDLIIKNWAFIHQCIDYLEQGFKFIGNGVNYPTQLNPLDTPRGRDNMFVEYVKDAAKHLFIESKFVQTLRESFICTTRKSLRQIFDFEVIWEEIKPDSEGKFHIGGIGNIQQTLLGYKISSVFPNGIAYLSNTYQDSEFLYECARGKTS